MRQCSALGRARSWSWTAAATILLDEVYAFLRAARWRALSRSWTAAATTTLDKVYYPTTDPAANFGLGPKAEAEGRVPIPGICCSASLTADFGSGWEAARRGTAGRGFLLLSTHLAARLRALLGSGGGVRSWTGSLHSTPGGLQDEEPAFHRLSESSTASGLARRRWRRGIWTKSVHPCASRRRRRADGGLAGRAAAAAGSCWTCWLSQECSAPSPSQVLCCRLCMTFTGIKKTDRERSGLKPSAFRRF